jgi:hypothetical protein
MQVANTCTVTGTTSLLESLIVHPVGTFGTDAEKAGHSAMSSTLPGSGPPPVACAPPAVARLVVTLQDTVKSAPVLLAGTVAANVRNS